MRKLPFISLVAAFSLIGSVATAAPYLASPSDTDQFQQLAGVYDLSNGKTLRLKKVYSRLYAEFNGQGLVHLSQTGRNTFASKDGTISIMYHQQSASADIVLQSGKNPSETLAQVPVASLATLAAR